MMHSEHMSRIITHMELYRYFYLNLLIFEHVELNLCTICLVVITRGSKGICSYPYYFFFFAQFLRIPQQIKIVFLLVAEKVTLLFKVTL